MKIIAHAETVFRRGDLVERAIVLAVHAHKGQKRKDGSPYIHHPLAVMAAFRDEAGPVGDVLRAAAVLHDVVEDCGITIGSIVANIDPEVGEIVDRLSRRPEELYADYVVRAAANDLARRVKIADVEDNLRTVDLIPDASEAKGLRRRYEWTLGVLK